MKKKLLYLTTALVLAVVNLKAQTTASLNFDGENDFVTATTTGTVTDAFTIEAWVKPANTNIMKVFSTRNSSYDFGFDFDIQNGNTIHADIGTGSYWLTTNASASYNYTIGSWVHIAYAITNTGYSIYANGDLVGTGTYSGTPLLMDVFRNKLTIGSDNEVAGGYMFNGAIDEVRVWNVARSQTEIQNNLNSSLTAQAGLIAYYNFNEGIPNGDNTSLSSVTDLSGSNFNGTLTDFDLTGTSSNFTTDIFQHFTNSFCLPNIGTNRALITSADYDGNGTTDFIATLNQTWLYKGIGSGNFDTPVQLFSDARRIESKDIDGDGDTDFIALTGNSAELHINDGNGNFALLTTLTLLGNIHNISFGDVNSDDKMDILFGNSGSNKTEVWLNTGILGAASFAFESEFNSAFNSQDLGDVDNDGDLDFVGGSSGFHGYLYLNDGLGSFTLQTTFTEYSGGIRLFDWNNDGNLDKVIYDRYNNYGFRVSLNDGSGNFQFPSTLWVMPPQPSSHIIHNCEIADFNADGFPDVVFNQWGGNAEVYLNTGCALVKDNNATLSQSSHGVYVDDFNNDERPDILCLGRDATSCLQINVMEAATVVPLSEITSVENDTACAGNSAELSAEASNGGTIKWYNSAISAGVLNTGSSYSTPALNNSATYYVDVTNANGCVSSPRVAVMANINQPTTSETTVEACSSYTWFGTTYDTSNDYTHVLQNAAGCDSTITLHLTINQPTTSETTVEACSSYTWFGTTYDTSNDYTHVLQNAAGCDSTITLHLTINQPTTSETTVEACSSYTWFGTTYDTSNDYTHVLENVAGCDSTITLHLTINQPTTSETTVEACSSYTWFGTTYDTSNDYTHVLENAAGCDSTITLHLTINQPTTSETTVEACSSYTWFGTTYDTSNDYTHVLQNAAGCDSTITLHLTIDSNVNTDVTQNGTTLTADQNGATYQWLDCDNANQPIDNQTNQAFTATANGNYAVMITNGTCSATSDCISVTPVGITENNTENVQLFPNPSNGLFNIKFSSNANEPKMVRVMNALGAEVYSTIVTGSSTLDLRNHSNGVYFVSLSTENSTPIILKVIKE